jgi:hypothetical protein
MKALKMGLEGAGLPFLGEPATSAGLQLQRSSRHGNPTKDCRALRGSMRNSAATSRR